MDVVTPKITPYKASFQITRNLGKKGIELIFKDKKVRLQVPPK